MGKSGNPAKAAAAVKESEQKRDDAAVSDVSSFKARAQGQIIKLPSGLSAKLKRVDLQTLIKGGSVHNPLMGIVSEAIEKGKGMDASKMLNDDEGEIDLNAVNDMFDMVNRICVACFVEPELHPLPEEDEEGNELDSLDEDDWVTIQALKDENLLYVDEIEAEDKMFIFQWSMGGTDDVATFREESRADMDALAEGKGSKRKAKRPAGSRK